MKNVVYFHGIHGDTQKSIAPFLEKEFAKLNIKTYYPKFFNDGEAFYENFKTVADDLFSQGLLGEDTIVIAHSIGNSFSTRYLCEKNISPLAFVSLAGYCDSFDLNNPDVKNQINKALPTDVHLLHIKTHAKTRISLYSNDHLIPENLLKNFSEKIDSKLYYLENKGHFGRRHGIQELPELIEILKENKLI